MPAAAKWVGPTNQLLELPESPSYELGDIVIQRRMYRCQFDYGESIIAGFSKGTAGTGAQSGYVVSSAKLERERGDIGRITVSWGAAGSGSGQSLPADEVSVQPSNLSPRLETHPLFAPLANMEVAAPDPQPVLDVAENVVRAQNADDRTFYRDQLAAIPLALKFIEKIRQGKESWYLASLRYSWATHSWTVPTMYRGGWIQAPLGPLANYFVADIDWLRESDDLQYSNGIWRLTRSWLGGPLGAWDTDLYG